ncbi:MAG: hypothetical protein Q9169_002240 [Polycauliona sp. 2 TL-2023]
MAALFLVAAPLSSSSATAAPKTLGLKFDVQRHQIEYSAIERRAKPLSGALKNEKIRYLMNITVGNPPQRFNVKLHTGSSDLWIPSAGSQLCQNFTEECLEHGSYNESLSPTSEDLDSEFAIHYGDCTGVTGKFITDTVGLFGVTMDDVQMGLAFEGLLDGEARQARGMLGIEFDGIESAVNQYPNMVSQLVLNGHINSRAYSIWLDDYNSMDDDIRETAIQMTSLVLEDESGMSELFPENTTIKVLLDTGATLSTLPRSIAEALYKAAGVVVVDGEPLVACSMKAAEATLFFGFGGPEGPQILVAVSELIVPALSEGLEFADGNPACRFGVEINDNQFDGVLGDTFLRSVYTVFDLDKKRIALARSNTFASFWKKPSRILEITNGTDGIPGVIWTGTVIPWPLSFLEGEYGSLKEKSEACG